MNAGRWPPLLALGLLLRVLAAQGAEPGFRPDQPEVIVPPPAAAPAETVVPAAFRQAYESAGRPSLMLFWNEQFDDQLRTQTQEVRAYSGNERRDFTRIVDAAKRRSLLGERDDTRVRAAFIALLAQAGIVPLDRAMAMRLDSMRSGGTDGKLVEAQAASNKAALLLEVVQFFDRAAPLGVVFSVTIKDLRTGAVTKQFTSQPIWPVAAGTGRYVASPNGGFVWSAPSRPPATPEFVGEELGRQTLEHWFGPRETARPPADRKTQP